MTRSTRSRFALLAIVPALACAVSCGKKGPPLAPLQRVPGRADEVKLRRLGNDVTVGFRIPDKNTDGSSPANLEKMELRALTGDAVDETGRALDNPSFVKHSALVAQVEIEPPPPPDEEEAEPSTDKGAPTKPAKPLDPRPAQGESIVVVETLDDAARTPSTIKTMRKVPKAPPAVAPTPPIAEPLLSPPIERPSRTYVVVGVNKKGQAGMPTARLAVPLDDPPPPPGAPTVKYTATAMVVEWTPSPGSRLAAAGAPVDAATLPVLPARPLGISLAPHTYNVYEVSETTAPGAAAAPAQPAPLNVAPLDLPLYQDGRVAFGVERCFVVRTVEAVGAVTLESAPSASVCVTPRDTFPPAAPKNLAAVAGEGAINLIWETNSETDLAGYVVLRGIAGAGALTAVTAAPVKETTYRDTDIRAGVRYVYAVVAVDTATPQNVSVESNRVEETAR